MVGLEVWIAFAMLCVTVIGHIVKSSVDKGRDREKIDQLEEWKKEIESKEDAYMTMSTHDRMQDSCRAEIYRDMGRIEENVNRLIRKLDLMEEKRERKEEEQNKKMTDMHETLADIKAYIKSKDSSGNIGVY